MAKVFLDVDETGVNIANDGDEVFGQTGDESVNILAGVTGVVLDGNIEAVTLDGNVADYLFQQQGNQLLVYSGAVLVATIPVQTDEDGTQMTFGDGTYAVEFGEGAVLELGGAAVPSDEPGVVDPGGSGPVEGETYELTTATDTITGTDYDDTIEGVVSGLSSTGTLNPADEIDGAGGTDTLQVEMLSNFNGFTGDGKLENVEILDLTNGSSLSRTFDASGATGIETIKIDANDQNFTVKDLAAAGLEVEVSNADGDNTVTIAYATDVTKGTADELNVTLNDVGTAKTSTTAQKTLDLISTGIETLGLMSSGTANFVDASGVDKATSISITGAGDLKLDDIGADVTEVDGSEATGDLTLDLTSATIINKAELGSGDDSLTLDKISATGVFDGGDGINKLVFDGTGPGNYKFTAGNFQTLEFDGLGGAVIIAADNVTDVETISVLDDMTADLTIANLMSTALDINLVDTDATGDATADTFTTTAAADVTVNVSSQKTTAGVVQQDDLILTKATAVTLNAGNYTDYQGDITAAEAQIFTANVSKGGNVTGGDLTFAKAESVVLDVTKGGVLTSAIAANKATSVDITTGDAQTFTLDAAAATTMSIDAGGAFDFAASTDFDALNSVNIMGTAAVDLSNNSIGKDASSVTVDASQLTGAMTVDIEDYDGTGGAAEVVGSDIGANWVTIGDDRNEINVTGGISNDTVIYNTDFTGANTEGSITIDLGTVSGGDILQLFAGANDFTSATVSISGVDAIEAGAGGNTLAMNAADLSGQSIQLGVVNAFGLITLEGTAAAETIDLSGIVQASTGDIQLNASGGADTIKASVGTDVFTYTAETQFGDTIIGFSTSTVSSVTVFTSFTTTTPLRGTTITTIGQTDVINLDVGGSAVTTGGKIFSYAATTSAANSINLLLTSAITAKGSAAIAAFGTGYANLTAFLSDLNGFALTNATAHVTPAAAVAFGLGANGQIWAARIETGDFNTTGTAATAVQTITGIAAADVKTIAIVQGVAAADIVLI